MVLCASQNKHHEGESQQKCIYIFFNIWMAFSNASKKIWHYAFRHGYKILTSLILQNNICDQKNVFINTTPFHTSAIILCNLVTCVRSLDKAKTAFNNPYLYVIVWVKATLWPKLSGKTCQDRPSSQFECSFDVLFLHRIGGIRFTNWPLSLDNTHMNMRFACTLFAIQFHRGTDIWRQLIL